MKITTRSSYAVRALARIAFLSEAGITATVKKISEQEEIAENFLIQILNLLKKKGLIKSLRGRNGGYVLANRPDKISVLSVVEAIGETFFPTRCFSASGGAGCGRYNRCSSKTVWNELFLAMNEVLRKHMIKSIMRGL